MLRCHSDAFDIFIGDNGCAGEFLASSSAWGGRTEELLCKGPPDMWKTANCRFILSQLEMSTLF